MANLNTLLFVNSTVFELQMVRQYEEEKPNLSYVRVNQNTSSGTKGTIKGYITVGLTASDPDVTNAGILHRGLLQQRTPPPPIADPFWSDTNGNVDGAKKEVSNIEDKDVVQQPQLSNAMGDVVSPVQQVPQTSVAAGGNLAPENASNEVAVSLQRMTICLPTGVKRKSEETSSDISTKVAKIKNSYTGLIRSNLQLTKDNAALKKTNQELQEKLNLLSKVLKDPRKRDMLNARLEQL